MPELAILHISELLFDTSAFPSFFRYSLEDSIHDSLLGHAPNLICVTGNIAFMGAEEQYEIADE